jgi:hypothetical protein
MFCDLVGSTSISAGVDAEDWHDLWRPVLRAPHHSPAPLDSRTAPSIAAPQHRTNEPRKNNTPDREM